MSPSQALYVLVVEWKGYGYRAQVGRPFVTQMTTRGQDSIPGEDGLSRFSLRSFAPWVPKVAEELDARRICESARSCILFCPVDP